MFWILKILPVLKPFLHSLQLIYVVVDTSVSFLTTMKGSIKTLYYTAPVDLVWVKFLK